MQLERLGRVEVLGDHVAGVGLGPHERPGRHADLVARRSHCPPKNPGQEADSRSVPSAPRSAERLGPRSPSVMRASTFTGAPAGALVMRTSLASSTTSARTPSNVARSVVVWRAARSSSV